MYLCALILGAFAIAWLLPRFHGNQQPWGEDFSDVINWDYAAIILICLAPFLWAAYYDSANESGAVAGDDDYAYESGFLPDEIDQTANEEVTKTSEETARSSQRDKYRPWSANGYMWRTSNISTKKLIIKNGGVHTVSMIIEDYDLFFMNPANRGMTVIEAKNWMKESHHLYPKKGYGNWFQEYKDKYYKRESWLDDKRD